MAKKLSKKELQKLEIQMGISKVQHDRPPVGRPTVFYGKTNKQKRRDCQLTVSSFFAKKTKRHRFRDVLGFFNLSHLHIRCMAVCIQHVKHVRC